MVSGLANKSPLEAATFAAGGRLAEDGRVTLEGEFRPTPTPVAAWPQLVRKSGPGDVTTETHMQSETKDETKDETVNLTAALAAAPIEVVAELGRLTLRGEEVVGLGPGAVLTLGRSGAAPVVLRVGGEVWAEGELCDVDGELGVRVTTTRRPGFASRSAPTR